jgi:hypothetical protein
MARCWIHFATAALSAVLLLLPVTVVESKAILGVDMGSLYMKVALVQRGAPLEIVTNFHSKRKTENMILFDAGTRFYGADASSLLARKPLKTPTQMSLMLGRDDQHPGVLVSSTFIRHTAILCTQYELIIYLFIDYSSLLTYFVFFNSTLPHYLNALHK